jgi:hypothetical protein
VAGAGRHEVHLDDPQVLADFLYHRVTTLTGAAAALQSRYSSSVPPMVLKTVPPTR